MQGSLFHADAGQIRRLREFEVFHAEFPEVYVELARRARLMLSYNRRFGIRTLWESMRWDFMLKSGPNPEPYKMNDHHTPFYSRLLMDSEPDLKGIFETRDRRDAAD